MMLVGRPQEAIAMAFLIVLTGLHRLPKADRWPRLIAPLAQELADSGLGSLPDLPSLRLEVDQTGRVEAEEVAIDLVQLGYGRQLVERAALAAGINGGQAVVPVRWCDYNCADCFSSSFAASGYFDSQAQFQYILPVTDVYEDSSRNFLVVGGPGVDGITWGYRRGERGLWAWYPIRGEFVQLSPTIELLLEGWLQGSVKV
jgi:hypothetical protein